MPSKTQLAEQQFLGFAHAFGEHSVSQLVDAMGLTESEWIQIRDQVSTYLPALELMEVDQYFESKAPVSGEN